MPAGFLRTDMRTERGCTVFAWFGGPAEFLAPEALIVTGEGITSVSVTDLSSNRWESSQSRWRLASLSDREPGEEIIDPMAGRWWRTGEPTVADLAESVLLRAPR
ncbi:hypothetical protein [Nocardioides alcanivorans]|uniref:hypothetical protein n=1 Tax=Nocardioides alcanivorans TaxID=2897352 RepID=UPI001F3841F0|nr:hypothetical protein [Nocardioides alcanivorans]